MVCKTWIVLLLLSVGCVGNMPSSLKASTPGAPGTSSAPCTPQLSSTPMQRLTQTQYVATATTLLHLAPGAISATDLPLDEVVGPFPANGVAAVADLSVQQYQTSAIALANLASQNLAGLLPCDPNSLSADCTSTFITQFGAKAFRRPLTSDEVARYVALANKYPATDPNSVRLVVQAFLQSPYFLYRPELGDPNAASATASSIPLTPYELASRLAFFFTNAAPDDTLMQAAASGNLGDSNAVRGQVARLISQGSGTAGFTNYITDLFGIGSFAGVYKDPNYYATYTPALQAAMQQETSDFLAYLQQNNRATLGAVLNDANSVLTAPLTSYYGVQSAAAAQVVALNSSQRAGILTRGAFLSIYGHANASAPVQRGKIIRENLLCQILPGPPPGVSIIPPPPVPGSSTRQRLLAHETDPSCAACHVLMDHIGLAFENYDGIGSWRTTDGNQPVDASGNIIATQATNVSFNGALALSTDLAGSADVAQCVSKQMFRFGMTRTETAADACLLSNLQQGFTQSGGDFSQLMQTLATSDAFMRLPR